MESPLPPPPPHISLCPIWCERHPDWQGPDRDRRQNRVAGRGDHRNGVRTERRIRHIDVFSVGGGGDAAGFPPTATVATTMLVAVSITETNRWLERKFAT